MVEIECFCVPSIVNLVLEAVVHLKVENLFDVEEDLDEPVLAELPIAEVTVKLQLPRHRVNQRMEYLCLKVDKRH